ncbi:MAG: aminotransferase class V-fold PLP-dependent enzyme [Gammaproteobacteria bacterium]
MSFDVERLRERFPTLARKTYLNSGSYGLLSLDVRRAFERYLDGRDERGSDWPGWMVQQEALRTRVAKLLNAGEEEIAITASASAGINAIASALDFDGARNQVVASDFEFPTSGQIWHAQEKRGARVVHVPEDAQGFIPLRHFENAIDERTRVVAITHVCFRNGAKLDVGGIVRLAHANGALVVLDCFQSVGAVPVDVKALGVDFAVGGMSKYLLGTAGIGFLYCPRELATTLTPSVSGWFAQEEAKMLDIHQSAPARNAHRFQAGTPPVPNCYAAAAGIDIILGLGVADIEAHVRALSGECMDRLTQAGFKLATPRDDARRGPTVAVRANDDNALVARLAESNIVTSSRDGNVRAMFHCYNNRADVDAFVNALLANRELLGT